MDKRKNITIVIRVIIVVALLFQLSRLDHIFVGNFTSNDEPFDLSLLERPKLSDRYPTDDDFVVYYSSQDANSLVLKAYFEQVLKDTKKSSHFYDLDTATNLDYGKKQMIILVEDLERLKDTKRLTDYIEGGGRVLFAQTLVENTAFYAVYRTLGINEAGPAKITGGLYIQEGLFPGYPGANLESEEFINFSIAAALDPDCRVYLTNKEKTPLLWTYDSGKGKVVVFNGTILLDKVSAGLIVRSIALMQDAYLYPIINSKVTFLDDYPAPFPGGNDETIRRDYDKNIRDFYLEIWWPDMLELANRYDLKYTAALIESYNDKTSPPFETAEGLSSNELVVLGREIIRHGGELGLHGYNHQSLTMDRWRSDELEYNYWASQADMEAALAAVRIKFKEAFPNYTLGVYVPPSNVIGQEGIAAIKKAIPECRIISSVFYEDYLGLNYSQNFEVDDNGLVHFPRFSSGYDNSDFNQWSIINGVGGYGVFSHFIHPDDFLDPERNRGKDWEGMMEEFEHIVEALNDHYPWLRSQTATQGGTSLINYLALDFSTNYGPEGIEIKTNAVDFPVYMILKSEHKPIRTTNCDVTAIDSQNYMVTLEQSEAFIEVAGE